MNRRRITGIAIAMISLALLLGACAERKNPADSSIRTHPSSWMDAASQDFHGNLVARDAPDNCTSCHGQDLMGEGTAPSCYECHAGPSGHPEGYAEPPEPFHPQDVAADGNGRCAACHGEDYRGGWAEEWASAPNRANCYFCHGMGPSGHPSGWLTPSSRWFHGNDVATDGTDRCTACHGADLMGGTSGVSCYNSCHASPSGHPADWLVPGSAEFHGTRVRNESALSCQFCHGEDYQGGSSGVSCYNACHDGPGGHPAGWRNQPAPFHGQEVEDLGIEPCLDCHTGHNENWTGWACTDCHVATSGF